MKTGEKINKKNLFHARVDPSMDKYKDVILFPEKLKQANENLKKTNILEFIKKNEESNSEKI